MKRKIKLKIYINKYFTAEIKCKKFHINQQSEKLSKSLSLEIL